MIINLTGKKKLLTGGKACPENIEIHPVLQEKEVTENGVVVPDDGHVGLSKVTVNVPDTVLEGVGRPIMPKLGRLKFFYNDRREIGYKDVYASNVEGTLGVTKGVRFGNPIDDSASVVQGLYSISVNDYNLLPITSCESVVVDGKKYFGYPCRSVSALWVFRKKQYYAVETVSVPRMDIPMCTWKVLMTDPNGTRIDTIEYTVESAYFAARTQEVAYSKQFATGNYFNIYCNPSGGLILAAEFVYPRGHITFSGGIDFLEYSLDDGVTFAPITDGLVLPEAEHVAIRNTSSESAGNIGTESNINAVGLIPPGETKFYEITEDATWHIC